MTCCCSFSFCLPAQLNFFSDTQDSIDWRLLTPVYWQLYFFENFRNILNDFLVPSMILVCFWRPMDRECWKVGFHQFRCGSFSCCVLVRCSQEDAVPVTGKVAENGTVFKWFLKTCFMSYLRPRWQRAGRKTEFPIRQSKMCNRHSEIFRESVGQKLKLQSLQFQEINFGARLGCLVKHHNFGDIQNRAEFEHFAFGWEMQEWNCVVRRWCTRCWLDLWLIPDRRHDSLEIFSNQSDLYQMWDVNLTDPLDIICWVLVRPEKAESVRAQEKCLHVGWQINIVARLPSVDVVPFSGVSFVVIDVRDPWDVA